ncbi:MAG: DUF4954 family protein [Treponema sp.]|nr:DUF4954 family protein [Treponema sp.]
MAYVTFYDDAADNAAQIQFPAGTTAGKRRLTPAEIATLKANNNLNIDESWQNILVDARDGCFDANLIHYCHISGFLIIGRLCKATLKYHDLMLETGLYDSYLRDTVLGDDVVVRNVRYLENYRIGNRVILFNIQEMSCTKHSKFGNGILKEGESESTRIWIGVGNENDGRRILPFESMIPADAFLWSRYREDNELLERFVAITESDFSKALNTYGIVEDDAVIKNTTLLKDAKVCTWTYIKGAFKLKNITILSSEDEPTQIGEGVELVNGIVGYGCHIFYQAVAVRFVIGRNCQLKYGARLLNSVLGDNSTISCCECLNNLIFPFHEQHHNSSFLIASTLCGQTNIASGATIGSNHNSRSPDGEMIAGRGFWPGLCSDFKHNSRFASFVLVAKGSYEHELNITYPFSLVISNGCNQDISILPAYWFLYNMYAVTRNKFKFQKRDKRKVKVQHIETDPLAPDTIQEVITAVDRIIELTGRYLLNKKDDYAVNAADQEDLYRIAKDYLHQNVNAEFTLVDSRSQKKYGATIYKPVRGYKQYRKILKYFAVSCLVDYCKVRHIPSLSHAELERIQSMPLYTNWANVGGQIIPQKKVDELLSLIKTGAIENWAQVHAFYDEEQQMYTTYKTAYALHVLEYLYSKPINEFEPEVFTDILNDVTLASDEMYTSAFSSREKDFSDYFRSITFRNTDEMKAVLGTIEDNEFLKEFKPLTSQFDARIKKIFAELC